MGPQNGTETTLYNAFGDTVQSVDAEQGVTTFDYDEVGRKLRRTDVEGQNTVYTKFEFDTAPNGLGQLASSQSPDGVSTMLAYEPTFGAARAQDIYVPGLPDNKPLHIEQTYDSFGQVSEVAYPARAGGAAMGGAPVAPFTIRNLFYNGSLQAVDRVAGLGGTAFRFWEARQRDAMDRLTQEAYGVDLSNVTAVATTSRTYYPKSGLLQDLTTVAADGTNRQSLSHQYRADGNLVRRFRPDLGEAFAYDALDRLTSWSEIDQETGQTPTGGFNVSYTYDESGNLRNRVATSGVGAQSLAQKYDGGGNAGPHAITSSDLWQDDNGDPIAFGYDRVGNVTSHPASGAITYTPFNLPRSVTGAAGSPGQQALPPLPRRSRPPVAGYAVLRLAQPAGPASLWAMVRPCLAETSRSLQVGRPARRPSPSGNDRAAWWRGAAAADQRMPQARRCDPGYTETVMTTAAKMIVEAALKLEPVEREHIANELLESIDESVDAALSPAWEAEIQRRLRKIESGNAAFVGADEVFARAEAILRGER